ncbi:MAG: hypothetical protein H7222_06680 [Methylotenera sp.]|nr:hypothetical protein [Oligoflexia bacterium]
MAAQAQASTPKGPLQIFFGNPHQGLAVQFQVTPFKEAISYTTFKNGKPTFSSGYSATFGIYSHSSLDFSGSDYPSEIFIHGDHTQILRINTFSAITVAVKKGPGTSGYQLKEFSEGSETTPGYVEHVQEKTYTQFLGLKCTVAGN